MHHKACSDLFWGELGPLVPALSGSGLPLQFLGPEEIWSQREGRVIVGVISWSWGQTCPAGRSRERSGRLAPLCPLPSPRPGLPLPLRFLAASGFLC